MHRMRPSSATSSHPFSVHALSWVLFSFLVAVGCTPKRGSNAQKPLSSPPAPEGSSEFESAAPKKRSHLAERARGSKPSGKVTSEGCGLPEDIRDPAWPRELRFLQPGPPRLPPAGAWTFAVLPDTQYYSDCRLAHLSSQAEWLVEQKDTRSLVAALTLGDLTEHNSPEEWQYVHKSLSPLRKELPLVLATGNHDYGILGRSDRRHTLFQETFSQAWPATRPHLVETMSPADIENAYYRFELPSVTIGVLVLEWSPRDQTVKWASNILHEHEGDRVILITHAYVYFDDTRYDWERYGNRQKWNPKSYGTALADPTLPPGPTNWHPEGVNDGGDLWNKLVRGHQGIFLTLSGHVLGDGQGIVTSRGDHGNLVHQVLVNYQMLDEGGQGYLRLIELGPRGNTLSLFTYSPSLDRSSRALDQQFILPVSPPLF